MPRLMEGDGLWRHGAYKVHAVFTHAEVKVDVPATLQKVRGVHLQADSEWGVLRHQLHENGNENVDSLLAQVLNRVRTGACTRPVGTDLCFGFRWRELRIKFHE